MPLVAWRASQPVRPTSGVVPGSLRVVVAPNARDLPRLRAEVTTWLDRYGIDRKARDDVTLALSEAVANAIEHGVPRRPAHPTMLRASIVVDARVVRPSPRRWWSTRATGARIECSVRDRGSWAAAPNDALGTGSAHGGRGLMIMHALTDECRVEHTRNGTRLLLVKHLAAPSGHAAPDPGHRAPGAR